MQDALGNNVIIGNEYGYSQTSNGSVWIVKGTVEKIEKGRATIANVQERKGIYGNIQNMFRPENRKRSVNTVMLFPIHVTQI